MGAIERISPELEDAAATAVWLNYYSSPDFGDNLWQIALAVSSFSTPDPDTILHIVQDAVYAPEAFDSLNPEADDTISEVLTQGVPVHLWTVGIPEIQQGKIKVVREKVRNKLVGVTESPEHAEDLMSNLYENISTYSKMDALGIIFEGMRKQNRVKAFVADDRWDNIVNARSIGANAGIEIADFRIDKDHPAGSFPACRVRLREWIGGYGRDKAVILDIDDTVFNETGPNGRIPKIAKIIARKVAAGPKGIK